MCLHFFPVVLLSLMLCRWECICFSGFFPRFTVMCSQYVTFLCVAIVTHSYVISMIAERHSTIAVSNTVTSQNSTNTTGTLLSTIVSSNFASGTIISQDNQIDTVHTSISSTTTHVRRIRRRRKYLLLPTLLIITYVIFCLCPDLLFFFDMTWSE